MVGSSTYQLGGPGSIHAPIYFPPPYVSYNSAVWAALWALSRFCKVLIALFVQVIEAFKILTGDPQVKAILVNIFGGIMKCDVIASGIVSAAKVVGVNIPLIVRLEGTNVEAGKAIHKESGMAIIAATDLDDAATKAVASIA